ncbi:hypothetical protein NE865_11635 [Phthorimaea operculella]|nr:hypothetical protein NE865_11635 [Phthorimaea operculella]
MSRSPPKLQKIPDDRSRYVNNMTDEPKCSSCNVIINELLAYIADKMDILHEKGMVQICLSAYSSEEIENARQVAYSLLAPSKRVLRRKEGSEEKSLLEIIKLIKEFEPTSLPVFVARTLSKLPPVTFDYVDVTAFLKEMTLLKNEISQLKAGKMNPQLSPNYTVDIESLKTDIQAIKQAINSQQSSPSFAQTSHTDIDNKQLSLKQRNRKENRSSTTGGSQQNKKPVDAQSHAPVYTCPISPELHIPPPPPLTIPTRERAPSIESIIHTPSYRDISINRRQINVVDRAPANFGGTSQCDDDGYTLVTKKKSKITKKKSNLCGSAPVSNKITVADIPIAIYVSRLSKTTSAGQLKDYVQEKGVNCSDIALLDQKYETDFNSFKITVPKSNLNKILDTSFWPAGIRYRIYRSSSVRLQRPSLDRQNKDS